MPARAVRDDVDKVNMDPVGRSGRKLGLVVLEISLGSVDSLPVTTMVWPMPILPGSRYVRYNVGPWLGGRRTGAGDLVCVRAATLGFQRRKRE